jgi:hypothetical protein
MVSDKRGMVTTFTPAGISTDAEVGFASSTTFSSLASAAAPPLNKAEISSPSYQMKANKETTGADCPS